MRCILFLAMLFAWLSGGMYAQTPSSGHVLDRMTQSLFERLDKTGLHSGILLQQSTMFVNPFRFDGVTCTDSNRMDASRFGKLFGQLRAASIGQPVLPDPIIYLDELRRRPEHSDTILLAVLALQFDYIKADALETGLLQWDADHKLNAMPGVSISPYRMDTTFTFTALTQQADRKQVVFCLPSRFVFNNLGWSVDAVQIDFGDGRGWQIVHPDECINVQYSQSGEKSIRLQLESDSRSWTAHSFISVSETSAAARYAETPDETVSLGGAQLSIFFDCEDHKIRKPLIIVEGFGGDMTNYGDVFGLLNIIPTGIGISLKDFLDSESYDLIWLDWSDANARIQDNAVALQAAIEYINARKHADGSSEPNAMICVSMGGLIGKYCLLNMHNVQGKDAEVERFFTYDSPLKGANFPVGIQLLIRDLLSLSGATASDPNIQAALQLLDGYSATQMLRQKAIIDGNGNLALSSAGFDALQAEINALSAIKPLTAITRHIAFSNGAGNGVAQESVTNAVAMEFSLTLDGVPGGGAPYWQYDVRLEGTAYTARQMTTLLYERTIKVIPIVGNTEIIESVTYTTPTALQLDVAPGGNSNIGLVQLEGALNNAFANVPDQIGYYVDIPMSHFCFVPTVSSFDLPVSTNLFNSTSGGVASRSSASLDNSIPSEYNNGQPEFNQSHVSINVRIADILVDELMPHPTTDALGATLSAGQTYNFGKAFSTITPGGILSTPREISQDLTIQNGGQLWINRKDRIADVSNTNNPQNIKPQAFFVSVPGDRCGGSQKVVVTIEDGGKLLVGDNASSPKNTGGLYFTSSSELYAFGSDPITLEDDAELTFDKNSRIELKTSAKLQAKNNVLVSATESTFVMESNSEIVFESNGDFRLDNTSIEVPAGSEIKLLNATSLSVTGQTSVLHIHAGATLRLSGESIAKIGSGATLILDPGAIIILESPESNIRIEGTLVWNGDINFSGLGYFEFTKTHALELNADAFRLTGADKNNRFIRIGGETTLDIPENKGLDLENGAVEHHGYEIQLNKASWCNLKGVKMYGTAATGFLGVQVGDIVVDDCTFDGLTSPFEITGSDNAGIFFGPATQVKDSDFHNYQTGAHFRERIGVSFENCQFVGSPGTYYQRGIFSEFNFITLVKDCTISDHDAGVLDASNNWADPLYTPDAGMGIQVEGGWILWMDGGEISNCEIGIGNQVLDPMNGAPTNVYMNHFATISGCHSGIVMNGDASTGLVMMDCARIIEIENSGIYGEDITLVIDPLLLLQMSGGTNIVDPNVFTRAYVSGSPNKYLNVCYVDKTSPEPLPAKLNFWGNTWGGTTYADANPNWSISLRKSTPTSVSCGASFTADVSQALQDEPTGCARQIGPIDPDECAVEIISGEPNTVRQSFRTGIGQINNEEYENAYATFSSVAGLWQTDLSGFSNYCETLIDASKSLSEGESRSQAIVKSPNNSYLFPNPASGEVSISLPAENCHLRIWDTFGKLVRETTSVSGIYRLDVSTWPGGLYWIDISAANGSGTQLEQIKLVVQR